MNTPNPILLAAAALWAVAALPAGADDKPDVLHFSGDVYMKFLDGNRYTETALYSNAETTPGEAGGDQGQGAEVELLFNAKLSSQVEVGGRIHSRFNRNFWANYGGFAVPDNNTTNGGEDDPRSNQYIKLRGAWVRLTPGYQWLDSATIGSNDWGMFDPWTQGQIRYIDRDNSAGFLFQGSGIDKKLRWDVARVSLSRLYQGPQFNTGNLVANDAAYIVQAKYSPTADWQLGTILETARDKEIDPGDNNNLNGLNVRTRYGNDVYAGKLQYSGLKFMAASGAFYLSRFKIASTVCDMALNGNCRFSPTPMASVNGKSGLFNLDFNELGAEGLTLNAQYFNVGRDFVSVTSSRREADVLLTEGQEATWQWGRPDLNFGNPHNGNSTAGLGYGGWDRDVQQVVSGMADNDFTDFDEPVAFSAIGWKGFTLLPKYRWKDWQFSLEYTDVGFNTNWQACGNADKDVGCIYPRMDGTHEWGLGGDYRSPYAPYQDRSMKIYSFRSSYTLQWAKGIDLGFRYKRIDDRDNRVTSSALLTDAYDGYPGAAGFALNPAWTPKIGLGGCLSCDDRHAKFDTYGFSAGYQLTRDVYGKFVYELNKVDLIDGTIDVAPVGMGFEASNDFGYAEYLTGHHTKNRLGAEFTYFLSGLEMGGTFDYFWGHYDPSFYTNLGSQMIPLALATGQTTVVTPLGNIPVNETQYRQYRMKVWLKVKF